MAYRQLALSFDGDSDRETETARDAGRAAQRSLLPETHIATPIETVCGEVKQKVSRLRPPVKAHGGKYYLARQIVPILLSAPGNPTEYLEPCAFGASVFLAMPRFQQEILGDINPDVVGLWRVLSHERFAQSAWR